MNKSEQLIACLEGEIASRDVEIERVTANCNALDDQNDQLRAELSALKAQGVVMQATDGGRNPRYEGLFDGETEAQRATRLNAAPVQQVSVPDGWTVERGYSPNGYVLHSPSGSMIRVCDSGMGGIETAFAMFLKAMLAAAPAAPAADAGLVEALDKIAAYAPCSGIKDPGFTKMHMGILARDALAAHSAKGVV